jgi:hypothetical protein
MNQSAAAAAGAVVQRPKFLRKITPKTVTDEVGINLLALNRPVQAQELYKLYGRIQRTKMTTTTLGESMGFLGDFRAVTPDGKRFMSGKAYIPVIDSMIYSSLQAAQDADQGGDPKAVLQVAVSIGIKPAPTNKPSMTGYEFDVQMLTQPAEDDPLARLEAQTAEQLALSGPGGAALAAGASPAASTTSTAGASSDAPGAASGSQAPAGKSAGKSGAKGG